MFIVRKRISHLLTWKSQAHYNNELQVVTLIIQKLPVPFTDQFIFSALINQPNSKPVLCGPFLPNHSDTLILMGM